MASEDKIEDLEPVLKRLQHSMQRAAFRHRFFILGATLGIGSVAWYAGGKDFVATAIAKVQAEAATLQVGVAERQAKMDREKMFLPIELAERQAKMDRMLPAKTDDKPAET